MKKLLAIFMSFAMVFSLSACKSSTTSATSTSNTGGLVGISLPTQSLQRWNQDGANLKKQLEADGYKVTLQFANNDVNTQVQQIENLITLGSKVLVIAAIDGTALTTVMDQAHKAGCKIVAYDRDIMNTPYVDYFCTFDNFKVGVLQGQYIADKLNLKTTAGPFNIELFSGDPGDNNAHFFYNGAMSILKPYITSGKLVIRSGQTSFESESISNYADAVAQSRMDNLITAYYSGGAKLSAILAPNDSTEIGIVASLKNSGYGSASKPYPVLTGMDGNIANVKAIIAGEASMTVFKDTRLLAKAAADMVNALLKGTKPEINDTTSYNNGIKNVLTYLCKPVSCDISNYKSLLIDSGYYTADQLK